VIPQQGSQGLDVGIQRGGVGLVDGAAFEEDQPEALLHIDHRADDPRGEYPRVAEDHVHGRQSIFQRVGEGDGGQFIGADLGHPR